MELLKIKLRKETNHVLCELNKLRSDKDIVALNIFLNILGLLIKLANSFLIINILS